MAVRPAHALQGVLLLPERGEELPRQQQAHAHARQLLRLMRRYSRPLAAATALARAVAALEGGSSCGRQLMRRWWRQLAEEFLEEAAQMGLFPRDQGRALALLEWQADREGERLRSQLPLLGDKAPVVNWSRR